MQINLELNDKEFYEVYSAIEHEYANKHLCNVRHRMYLKWEDLKKAKPNQPNLI